MLRITCMGSEAVARTVKVEGRISGEYVAELSRVASEALETAPHILLDLSDVTFVDQDGAALLRTLRRRGVELVDCSSFVLSLVNGGTE